MQKKRKAIIIGGSLGGLLSALYLQKNGFDVDVYERSEVSLSDRGAGIVSHSILEETLHELGLFNFEALGFRTVDRKYYNQEGIATEAFLRNQIHFSWNKLYNALLDLLGRQKYHLSHDLVETIKRSDKTAARFTNGTVVEADLLVGADGLGSRVRQQHAPTVQPVYSGYVGWRGIVEARLLPDEVNNAIGSTFGMSAPSDEQFVIYPVIAERDHKDEKCYNFVWYRPAHRETALKELLKDRYGHTHTVGIPPPLIRDEVLLDLKNDAALILPPQLAAVVDVTVQPFLQPIYDLVSTQMVFGRNIVLGDAAFVARPHVGAGVTKAAADAKTLSKYLMEESRIEDALQHFEQDRLDAGSLIIDQARYLGRSLTGGTHLPTKKMLSETAWLHFLERETQENTHEG